MPQQPVKVLFADDSATMRKVAEITFASDDYDLVLLEGGADIVAGVKNSQPKVVVLDADMPDVNGYDACRQLRGDAGTAGVPVLLLSGPSSPYDERKASQAGVSDHIDKPFESQAIFDKLDALMAAPPAQPLGAPSAAASPKPPAAAAAKEPPPKRAKAGNKTVLGVGGKLPPIPSKAAPKPAPMAKQPAPPAQRPAPPAAKPKLAPQKPPVRPAAAKPEKAPAAKPAPAASPAAAARIDDAAKTIAEKVGNVSPEQVDAIRAVSRDVIEAVVWEVVPDLAETIIKEELAKLLKE